MINNEVIYRPLKRRFYILFSFCIYAYVCGLIWNSWQPLIASIKELYEWDNSEVNLLNNINAIVFCVLILPYILLWNKFGIKFCYTTSSCIVLLGCLVRVFPARYNLQSILIQVGNAISAYGNLMTYVGSTAISAIWFPAHERSRSTCTALAFSTLGSVSAPLAASRIVPTFVGNQTDKRIIELGMQEFMFMHCAISFFSLFLIIIYFPSKPKYLPCKSSDKSLRIDIKGGVTMLARNKQFWIVFVLNFITSGVNSGVVSVLPSIIEPLGVTQKEIGVMVAVGNLFVFIGSLIGGWLGDKCSYKKIVLFTTPPTVLTFVMFGLQSMKYLRHGLGEIYALVMVMLLVSNVVSNISFEMGCEVSFPASEEITTAVLGFATNFGIVAILSVSIITDKNVNWIPYAYAAAVALLFPLMLCYSDERKRSNCDKDGVDNDAVAHSINDIQNINPESELDDGELEDCSLVRFPS